MKTIGKITFDFRIQNETFARELYARWNSFFASNVERITDEILSKHDITDHVIEIEKLDLDLGSFTEENLDEYFPIALKEKLKEALLQCLHNSSSSFYLAMPHEIASLSSQISTQTVHVFELLTSFLLHGTLPWNTDAKYKDINRLFLQVLQENGQQLRHFLFTYGHYSSLQQRLVYQLSDPQLEKGVRLLSPDAGDFIVSHVHLLKAKHKETQQPNIAGSDYRNSAWLVIYAYLLTNRSSYFDKKTFVAQTILQLANRYNLSYPQLLELLAKELRHNKSTRSIVPELFVILEQLKKELDEKQFKESSQNAAKFYQMLSEILQDNLAENISGDSREALILILSKADSCRTFLQSMKEDEIYELVKIVIPNNSEFVIETAKSLDRIESEKLKIENAGTLNSLQGKAGGEFRLLKWQIIFSILFENQGSAFHRKQFVRRVFQQTAAHYNLELVELLGYFYDDPLVQQWMDKDLREIFQELFKLESRNDSLEINAEIENFSFLISHFSFNNKERNAILQKLVQSNFRRKIINELKEAECYQFILKLFPRDGEFIIQYAKALDEVQNESSLSTLLKWDFIFSVLSEMPADSFNRSYFVRQVLQRIASHFNLEYIDLLLYFQSEEAITQLPYQLHVLLKDLFENEKRHWIEITVKNAKEADKYKLLAVFWPSQRKFIIQYAKALDKMGRETTTQQDAILFIPHFSFLIELKWQFIFTVLFEMQNIAFNKKQFLLRTLTRIANHYHLPLSELILYFSTEITGSLHSSFKEIASILKELQQEQTHNSTTKNKQLKNATSNPINDIKTKLLKSIGELTLAEQNLLEELWNQTEFISYSEKTLKLLPDLLNYFSTELKVKMNHQELFKFLLELSAHYQTLSLTDIFNRLLEWLCKPLTSNQKQQLNNYLQKSNQTNYLINILTQQLKQKTMKKINEMETGKLKLENEENSQFSTLDPQFINNAGLVLLSPYFPRLFSMLDLTDSVKFINEEAQIRAMFLLQYAAFGKTEFPEHEMSLNKLLTDFQTGKPIPRNIELTKEEKDTVESMLKSVLQNWAKLRNTSIEGLRQGFLQREGKLEEKEDFHQVTVQDKSYDMLLDSVPWNFRTIKSGYMKKRIEVKWR